MILFPRQGWVRNEDPVCAEKHAQNNYMENDHPDRGFINYKTQIKQCIKTMAANRISLSFWYMPGENWENTKAFRYLRLFKLLIPELSTPKTTSELTRFLGNILNPDLEKTVRKDNPTPTNTIKKIMADFCILKLVKSVRESRNLPGEEEAWEVTEFGREVFAICRLRQLNREQKILNRDENAENIENAEKEPEVLS